MLKAVWKRIVVPLIIVVAVTCLLAFLVWQLMPRSVPPRWGAWSYLSAERTTISMDDILELKLFWGTGVTSLTQVEFTVSSGELSYSTNVPQVMDIASGEYSIDDFYFPVTDDYRASAKNMPFCFEVNIFAEKPLPDGATGTIEIMIKEIVDPGGYAWHPYTIQYAVQNGTIRFTMPEKMSQRK